MRILVTNDDGVHSEGMWTLARELSNIARVIVVAPDREQSGIGTAVTLRQVLRVHKVRPPVPEVETYAVDGTPSDSVILALGKLVKPRIDMVISGINNGLNLGEDVHISGTVGAALHGYLRGFPSLAISAPYGNNRHAETAARLAAILARKIACDPSLGNIFLNVNLPDVPLSEIKGAKITRLASESHINTVDEGDHGKQKYYWLLRRRSDQAADEEADTRAIEEGNISITPLWPNRPNKTLLPALNILCADLTEELLKV